MDILRKAFADISAGYSFGKILSRPCYIKHLNYSDQVQYDEKYDQYFKEAKDNNIPTNSEREIQLIKSGVWKESQNQEIKNIEVFIEGIVEGKKKHTKMPSMIKRLNEQIKEEEKKLQDIKFEKQKLFGLTCEIYADKQLNDYYIFNNLFKDKNFTISAFSPSEFDYLSDSDIIKLIKDYNEILLPSSLINIKKLAMQPFFQEYLSLIGDNLFNFFGKPVYQLTFSQIKLLSYGQCFKNIYSSNNTKDWPKTIIDDPDAMIDYANSIANGKADASQRGAYEEGAINVGIKKEDAKALGLKTANNIGAEIARNGGDIISWAAKRG